MPDCQEKQQILDDLKEAKGTIAELVTKATTWPKANFEITFNLHQLTTARKEHIVEFAQRVFAVIGTNCEMFAVFTGYWDETLTAKHLGERAEKLGILFQA